MAPTTTTTTTMTRTQKTFFCSPHQVRNLPLGRCPSMDSTTDSGAELLSVPGYLSAPDDDEATTPCCSSHFSVLEEVGG
ncbi:hypothetical protein MKZ38_000690 [Zalerion maritima]|uniref:Uncharacterized protein n=1 Tax=Zalerion maritima TaxID=339359 RepID=A0AAD5WSE9_9PEZI|nr:hypothetical protein MKZ38_000690 [Zalerion maritima]